MRKFLRFWWIRDLRVGLVGIAVIVIILAFAKIISDGLIDYFITLDWTDHNRSEAILAVIFVYAVVFSVVTYGIILVARYQRFLKLENGERVIATVKQYNPNTHTVVFDIPVLSVDRIKYNRWLDPSDNPKSMPVGRSFIVTFQDNTNPISQALLKGTRKFYVTVSVQENGKGTITEMDNWGAI